MQAITNGLTCPVQRHLCRRSGDLQDPGYLLDGTTFIIVPIDQGAGLPLQPAHAFAQRFQGLLGQAFNKLVNVLRDLVFRLGGYEDDGEDPSLARSLP